LRYLVTSLTSTFSSRLRLPKADHIGIAASVLCAIHCAVAPFLLLALPAVGKIWAHPASHILVALLVVPLAAISIQRGYVAHRKRWVLITAYLGILVVLAGSALPLFSKGTQPPISSMQDPGPAPESNLSLASSSIDDTSSMSGSEDESFEDMECIDNCCPSLQITESGESELYVPPAAIVTTLGGIFLIVAHIGNICCSGRSCRAGKCDDC